MTGKHAIRAAICAGMLVAGAGSAHALELKDLVISFDVISTSETVGKSIRRGDPNKFRSGFQAIAGMLVMYGSSTNCRKGQQSLVYKPGANSGAADCPVIRWGSATSWLEKGGTATYNTNLTITGNVLTLQGKMIGRGTYTRQHCGDRDVSETEIAVTQDLKIRINGMTCQVLQYNEVHVENERDTYHSSGGELKSEVTTRTQRLAPNAKCTVRRRSELPVVPPPELADVVGKC